MTRVEYSPHVKTDLLREARFYEDLRKGLGRDLVKVIARLITKLRSTPGLAQPARAAKGSKIHRLVVPRFPLLLLYVIRPSEVRILAIAHQHRSPATIKKLLRRE